jgi:hypothetical protein
VQCGANEKLGVADQDTPFPTHHARTIRNVVNRHLLPLLIMIITSLVIIIILRISIHHIHDNYTRVISFSLLCSLSPPASTIAPIVILPTPSTLAGDLPKERTWLLFHHHTWTLAQKAHRLFG